MQSRALWLDEVTEGDLIGSRLRILSFFHSWDALHCIARRRAAALQRSTHMNLDLTLVLMHLGKERNSAGGHNLITL